MRQALLIAASSLVLLLSPAGVDAQATSASSGSPAPAASGAPSTVGSTAFPAPLVTNDPMLEPVAPPAHVIGSWEDALASLRSRSTDYRIALDEIERSEGLWRQTLAASLPQLTGSANVTSNLFRGEICSFGPCIKFPDAFTYGGSITLNQPLFAPRAWYAAGTASLAKKVTELSAEDQKRVLSFALANAVVSVVTSERLSEINRIGLRAALERLTLAKRRVALGAGNALDTVRADQDVSVARAAVVTGDESLRRARETLGLALGSPEGWGVPSDINMNGIEASARATCSAAATLDERADIAALRTQTEVAARNVNDAKLLFSPTVNLVSRTDASSNPLGNGLHHAWSIAAVLTIPFYDGGSRYGALRDTRAQADQSQQRLEALRRNATIQIAQARRSVEVTEESRRVVERSRELARETERLSRVSFQAGTGTSLDLIESGRRLREAESQLALQEFNVVQSRIAALLSLSRCNW